MTIEAVVTVPAVERPYEAVREERNLKRRRHQTNRSHHINIIRPKLTKGSALCLPTEPLREMLMADWREDTCSPRKRKGHANRRKGSNHSVETICW